ncbi:UDP-N-acetylglucosamine transferase subunit ALG14 homolog isoform X4 [Brassica napus]|uniref:UDP-N-acetylglucosamine transferase subunit ALG14 homolog isoform X4 n=1 Tax=Brassica napus TaxID=3708 RepID=UPI00207A6F8F|nr:UDP-N-acetylglucosamine transferase subunit ALG14 homolog isoform X4 [Brassica napus]
MHLPFTPNRLVNLSNGSRAVCFVPMWQTFSQRSFTLFYYSHCSWFRYTPRFYIAAATDNMSLQKARSFEHSLPDKLLAVEEDSLRFTQIYRSREVGQSYVTSVWTTIVAIVHALWLMIRIRPQVILCNGPGTCIPLCVIAFLFKVLGIRWSSIFYVESVARVKKLSLSGLLLYNLRMADQFFVQWPQLQKNYPRAHYVGCLM